MHFEAALNLLWLSLGVIALASAARAAYRQRTLPNGPIWLHVVGAALIVAALFPFISATDDVLRIQQLNSQQKHHGSSQKSANDDLIRLFQTMDTPLVSTARQAALTLFFVVLLGLLVVMRIDRNAPSASGRSPPRLALA